MNFKFIMKRFCSGKVIVCGVASCTVQKEKTTRRIETVPKKKEKFIGKWELERNDVSEKERKREKRQKKTASPQELSIFRNPNPCV